MKYTIVIVPEDAQNVKQLRITGKFFGAALAVFFVLIVAGLFYINFSLGRIEDDRARIDELSDQVKAMVSSNIMLQAENDRLTIELADANLSLTTRDYIQQMTDSADALRYIPSGLPVDGQLGVPGEYSEEEHAISFPVSSTSKIISTGAGTVMKAEVDLIEGYIVQIDHENGYHSFYFYDSKPLVREGDHVLRGTALYTAVRNENKMTYQVSFQGRYIDPNTIMKIDG